MYVPLLRDCCQNIVMVIASYKKNKQVNRQNMVISGELI